MPNPRKPRNDKGKPRKDATKSAHVQVRLNGDVSMRPKEARAASVWHKLVRKHGTSKIALIELILESRDSKDDNWQPATQVTVDAQLRQMLKRAVDLLEGISNAGFIAPVSSGIPQDEIGKGIADFKYDAQGLMGNAFFFEGGE